MLEKEAKEYERLARLLREEETQARKRVASHLFYEKEQKDYEKKPI